MPLNRMTFTPIEFYEPVAFSEHTCEESGPRERTLKDGRKVYATQCKNCGRFMHNVAKAKSLPAECAYDEGLQKDYWRQRNERLTAEREEKNRVWWEGYNEHLSSPKWKATREKVIKRAGGICEGCGERSINDVHHLTYDHVGDELLFELVGLCFRCHGKIHNK